MDYKNKNKTATVVADKEVGVGGGRIGKKVATLADLCAVGDGSGRGNNWRYWSKRGNG